MQKLDERITQQMMRADEINLRQYWNVVKRRKWWIASFSVAAAIAAGVIVSNIAPVYRATATIMMEAQPANIVSIQDIYGMETKTQEYFQTQFEILKSRPIAEKVTARLNLLEQPEYLPAPEPVWKRYIKQWLPKFSDGKSSEEKAAAKSADPFTGMVTRYGSALTVTPIPKTQLVSVSYNAEDPALAAAVVNAHAQAFIESHMEAREAMTRSASQWMTSRVDELKEKLNASEKRLQDFREREHLVDTDQGIQALQAHEISDLSTKLLEARRVLSENRNAFDQVNSARSASLDAKLAIPAINSDALVKQFRQSRATAELKVAELAKRYGAMHPKMTAALSERDAAVEALERQVNSVIDSIGNQQSALQGQERAISSALSATKAGAQSIARKSAEYRSLMQEVETNRQLYDLFNKRISETHETGDLATAHARVIEPAVAPTQPTFPKRNLVIALAFMGALIFSIAMVLLLEMLDNTIKNAEDLEHKLGLPLMGLIPHVKRSRKYGKRIGHAFVDNRDRKFGESIRTLRTAITLSNLDTRHKMIMFTSSVGDEGKTSIACNVALAFSQLERVLLIDADMRRPSVAQEFSINGKRCGLSALCAGTASLSDCIASTEVETLDVLLSGDIPPNPQELLASQKLRVLLQRLSEIYDRIVIDCPPVLPVSDAMLLANAVDAAVYVVRADKTPVSQIKRGIELLSRTRVEVLGVALNQTDTRKSESYGDYGAYLADNYNPAKAG